MPICVKGEPCTVEWEDAFTTHDNVNSEKYVKNYKPLYRTSNGTVIGFDEKYIHFAYEYDLHDDLEDDCEGVTTIPLAMVRRIRFHDSGTEWPEKKKRTRTRKK